MSSNTIHFTSLSIWKNQLMNSPDRKVGREAYVIGQCELGHNITKTSHNLRNIITLPNNFIVKLDFFLFRSYVGLRLHNHPLYNYIIVRMLHIYIGVSFDNEEIQGAL